MQKSILLTLSLFCFLQMNAQIIMLSPEKPSNTDLVTLTFDASQGNQGLMDHEGPIYAHTGVLTNQSTHPGDWRHVVAGWDENKDVLRLEQVDKNRYQLQFRISELFDIPNSESTVALAFVFRNENGTKVGKEKGGARYLLLPKRKAGF